MAAFVIVLAGSYGGLHWKLNLLKFVFVFFHCRHKMKSSCYQDYSVIRSWFVYFVLDRFGLRNLRRQARDSTQVAVGHANLLAFSSCIQGEPEIVIITVFVSF